MADIDTEGELPIIIELPKDLLVQGLQMQVEDEVSPESVAFDTGGFLWDDSGLKLDLTFSDKGGMRLASVYIDPALSSEHSIVLAIQIEVSEHVSPWSLAQHAIPKSEAPLREAFPHAYRLCKDDQPSMSELHRMIDRLEQLEEEIDQLLRAEEPS